METPDSHPSVKVNTYHNRQILHKGHFVHSDAIVDYIHTDGLNAPLPVG